MYLHSGPSICVDFSDLVSDLLREEARTPFFLVAQYASFSYSAHFREQINLRQPGLPMITIKIIKSHNPVLHSHSNRKLVPLNNDNCHFHVHSGHNKLKKYANPKIDKQKKTHSASYQFFKIWTKITFYNFFILCYFILF